MKTRGSNTGCGSKHLGEGGGEGYKQALPRLLPLSRPPFGTLEGILGVRQRRRPCGLGVDLPEVCGERRGLRGVRWEGLQGSPSVPKQHRARSAEGDADSCGPFDSSVYALRHAECPPGGWGLARPDAQLPLLRGSYRLREGLLGGPHGRGDGQAAQEGRDGTEVHGTAR